VASASLQIVVSMTAHTVRIAGSQSAEGVSPPQYGRVLSE
jgi:hypothetical protein